MLDLHLAVFHNSPFMPLRAMIKVKKTELWGLSMSFELILIDGETKNAL